MILNHVGITNESEEKALRFYRDFLGFEKTKEYSVLPELSVQLFSLSRDIKAIVFERDGIKIEVFICPECKPPFPDIGHIGFLLDDFQSIKEKAKQAGVEFITGKTRDKTVYFIKDFSGNLIEIKPK